MDGNEICWKCDNSVEEESNFMCDSCESKIHKDCAELSASELKCMPMQKRKLIFLCTNCKDALKKLPSMINLLNALNTDVKEIKNKINDLGSSTAKVKSYAEILTAPKQPEKKYTQGIIFKPTEGQNVQEATKEIQNKIKPSTINIGIKNIKHTKSGSIIVKCETKENTEALEQLAKKTLKKGYEISTTKLNKPRIKIVNVKDDKNTVEEIETNIRNQNGWIEGNDYFKITYVQRKKNNEITIFAECASTLYNKFIEEGKVCLNWGRYKVYEDISINRCFKCQEFYHKKTECKNTEACENCGETHNSGNCTNNYKCKNCESANKKYKLNYNTQHAASDKKCPSYMYQIDILRSKIDYN